MTCRCHTPIRLFASILCVCLFFAASSAWSADDLFRTVRDSNGNEVRLPAKIDKVAPTIGAFAQMTCILSQGEVSIAAGATNTISHRFKQVVPWYEKGNPNNYDASSIEDILASKAQVVYGPGARHSTEQQRQLEEAGVPFVLVDKLGTVADLCESYLLIGDILGGNAVERAKTFVAYYKGNMEMARTRTAAVKKRIRFISMNYAGNAYSTINRKDICHEYIDAAGGENVSADYHAASSASSLPVDIEQLIRWDPEVIMMGNQQGREAILADPSLIHISAIKAKRVYVCPFGIFRWSARSGEGAMLPLWLGKNLHPELFADIDMQTVVRDFFKQFYAYDITDKEIDDILEGRNR